MTRPMSPIDSPLLICSSSLRSTIGVPPSSATPTSNETRVRVEGCSKISATDLPASESAPGAGRSAFSAAARVEQRVEPVGDLGAGDEVRRTGGIRGIGGIGCHGSAARYSCGAARAAGIGGHASALPPSPLR